MPETVRVDGRDAVVRRWPGQEPTVVLVHGAGGNHDSLGSLGDALSERGMAVVAPSLPGRCGSEGAPCSTVAQAAAWVVDVCDALDLPAPLVAGHSFGGGVALEAGLSRPERFSGLVLMATGARLRVHPTILEVMEEAARTGRPADAGRMAWRPTTDPAVIDGALAVAARTPPATTVTDWRAADQFDRMGDLGLLAVPALVVGGTDDALTPPKYASFLADRIPHATLHLLEGQGHMVPLECPHEVAEAIAAFRSALRAI
jgi:pimeloyl-ACP methyl ester carboxylesterase